MCYLGRLLKEAPTIVSNLYSLGLTQQASVRRGPPCLGDLSFHGFRLQNPKRPISYQIAFA